MKSIWVSILLWPTLFVISCAQPEHIDLNRVEAQVRRILVLHTHEHVYRDIVFFGEEQRFLGIRTVDRRVLFSINIRVQGGIDLESGFRLISTPDDRSSITVRLPPARVLLVDADETSIHQYFVREVGGSIGFLEIADQIEEIKRAVQADSVARGLLVSAQENGRALIRSFLRTVGFTTITFLEPAAANSAGTDQ